MLYRSVHRRLLVCTRTTIGVGGKRLFVPHTNDYTLVCGTNTCLRVTDYFFYARSSIGRLRRRSKHLGEAVIPPYPQ